MMWLGVDSIRSKPIKPELYSTIETKCMCIPDVDKVIKIGNSEFTGTLKTNDYFIMVDDSKFDYAADWGKEIQKARDVSSAQLRQARQEGYAQGVEAQKKKVKRKRYFLETFLSFMMALEMSIVAYIWIKGMNLSLLVTSLLKAR